MTDDKKMEKDKVEETTKSETSVKEEMCNCGCGCDTPVKSK